MYGLRNEEHMYGPSELVVDFRNIQKLSAWTEHVVMDCTHAAQETYGNDGKTGGNRAYMFLFRTNGQALGLMPISWRRIPIPIKVSLTGPICWRFPIWKHLLNRCYDSMGYFRL